MRLGTPLLASAAVFFANPAAAQVEHESPAVEAALRAAFGTCALYVDAIERGVEPPRLGQSYRESDDPNLNYVGYFEDGAVGIIYMPEEPSCTVNISASFDGDVRAEIVTFMVSQGFREPEASTEGNFWFRVDGERQKVSGITLFTAENGVLLINYSERDLAEIAAGAAAREADQAETQPSSEGTPQRGLTAALNIAVNFCPTFAVQGPALLETLDPAEEFGLQANTLPSGAVVFRETFADGEVLLVPQTEPLRCGLSMVGENRQALANILSNALEENGATALGSGDVNGAFVTFYNLDMDGAQLDFMIGRDDSRDETQVFVSPAAEQ